MGIYPPTIRHQLVATRKPQLETTRKLVFNKSTATRPIAGGEMRIPSLTRSPWSEGKLQGSALSFTRSLAGVSVPIAVMASVSYFPTQMVSYVALPFGAAGGMQSTARLVGQTSGAVIMAILCTLIPVATAPRVGLVIAAVLALAGGAFSILRRER